MLTIDQVNKVFESHLISKSLRKTDERFFILDQVYKSSEHFEAESLYYQIKDAGRKISLATVYNTLNLLVECDLVKIHRFTVKKRLFERGFNFKHHDHLICLECNKITEFCDPRIGSIQNNVGDTLGYNVNKRSLTFFGNCTKISCLNLPKL